ncbi:MAG: hypothetical protein ISR88_05975 [Candidatus Marinimicrobia bacterium]|nr:hypothetical protein [Candidatus Neomarinimicrobiota bacterium]
MYIVAIMITAVIFSATGLGVLNLATIVNLDTQNAVQTVQDQVEVESFANVALWRVNAGGDNLGNFTVGNVSAAYDSTLQRLTVVKTTDDETNGLILDLSEDSHFKRAVATQYGIDLNGGNTISEEPAHQLRSKMEFLPQVDWTYLYAHAAQEIWMWNDHVHQEDLVEGINIIHGSFLDIHDVDMENVCLVFTGYDIQPKDDVKLKAMKIGGVPLPAVILTNQYNDTHFDQGYGDELHIEGAIYSAGHVRLHEGEFTGPVIARTARICRDIDMLDDDGSEYYQWNLGFGNYEDYDWPKQIQEWARID